MSQLSTNVVGLDHRYIVGRIGQGKKLHLLLADEVTEAFGDSAEARAWRSEQQKLSPKPIYRSLAVACSSQKGLSVVTALNDFSDVTCVRCKAKLQDLITQKI